MQAPNAVRPRSQSHDVGGGGHPDPRGILRRHQVRGICAPDFERVEANTERQQRRYERQRHGKPQVRLAAWTARSALGRTRPEIEHPAPGSEKAYTELTGSILARPELLTKRKRACPSLQHC